MNAKSELNIYCELIHGCDHPLYLQIQSKNCKTDICRKFKPREKISYCLEEGEYKIRVSSNCMLDPSAITKWLYIKPCRRYNLNLVFFSPICRKKLIPVCFTITDSNYPGITPLNGGITVWRQHRLFLL